MPTKPFEWDNFEVGETFDPFTVTVTQEMVDQHMAALDSYHPWFTESSPFGRPIAPPTAIDRPMAQWLFSAKFSTSGDSPTMHARQQSEFLAPIYVGETPTPSAAK